MAEEPEAASFYLRELFDCVTDRRRASGLTVEDARADLAANEALLRQFDRMSEHPAAPVTRPKHGAPPESPQEPAERPRRRAQVAARSPASKRTKVGPQRLHRAAKAYLGIDGYSAGGTPRERLADLAAGSSQSMEVLLAEMEGTIELEDLPDCDEVVRLFDEGKVNLLVLPFAAGLHSLGAIRPTFARRPEQRPDPFGGHDSLHASQPVRRPRQHGRVRHVSPGVVSDLAEHRSGAGSRRALSRCDKEAQDGGAACDRTPRVKGTPKTIARSPG